MRRPLRFAPAPARLPSCRLAGATIALFLSAVAVPLEASTTPVLPVPSARWGTLEPRDILLDSSWYQFNFEPGCGNGPTGEPPYWVQSVDVQGNVLFAATGNHVVGYDISNPAVPTELFNECRPSLVTCCLSDTDWFFNQVRAPKGDSSVMAIAGDAGLGLVVLRTASPASPSYQDADVNVAKIALLRRSSAPHDVVVANLGGSLKFALYDLQKAKSAGCYERNFAGGAATCSSAQSPFLGTSTVSKTDHFLGVGRYLVTSRSNNLEVWDFANLAAPVQVGAGATPFTRAIDAWEQNGQLFVAAAGSQEVYLYSYPVGLSCGGLCQPTLITTLSTPGGFQNNRQTTVDSMRASQDGGRTYLYVGSGGIFGTGPQREWIFDVTNPALAEDLTPPSSGPDGYWGWYYHDNGGFDNIDPGDAVVGASHLFRSARGLLDVHSIELDAPPTADFTWTPSGTIYVGDTLQLIDASTRDPLSWQWTIGALARSEQNPTIDLTGFPVGSLQVTLVACNNVGCSDPVTKTLQLADPTPTIGSVTVSSSTARPCETIRYTANSPAGKPPLTYNWKVFDGSAVEIEAAPNGGTTYDFAIPGSGASSSYRGELTLVNGSGQAQKASPLTTIEPLGTLGISALTYDTPIVNGVVQFHLTETAATRWEWFWDVTLQPGQAGYPDGPSEVFTLASQGRDPTHAYPASAADETYRAVVRISNCASGATVLEEVTVDVPAFLNLEINRFDVTGLTCILGSTCTAIPGTQVTFILNVEGAPELFDYDWNGDGDFDDAGIDQAGLTAPPPCDPSSSNLCHTHTFPSNTTGTFRPNLRIRRGTSSETRALGQELQFSNPTPPSVSVSGPTSLLTGQSGSFSASASNCTPTGWSWSASGGGAIIGTGSAVSASWSSAGSWSITATAQGGTCGNASGLRSVSVSSSTGGGGGGGGGGGTGGLAARFTRTPSGTVTPGQQVTFDPSTSSGSPTSYLWNFGDGSTLSRSSGSAVTHTFTSSGSYTVTLEVAKSGDCSFNICTHSTSATVQVSTGSGGSGGPSGGGDGGELEAKFTFAPQTPLEGEAVAFDGSSSTGSPTSWSWDFGDGATGSGKNVSHTYAAPGTYTVELTVGKFAVSGCGEDNLCTDTVTKQVTVEALQRDGTCVTGPDTLCLRNFRFEVTIELTGQPPGTFAQVVPGQTGDSGLFWFFDPANWEVLVKVLDGCAVTDAYWVFAASTTDQGYVITVTDTLSGESVEYVNQAGNPAPAVTDTGALPVCQVTP